MSTSEIVYRDAYYIPYPSTDGVGFYYRTSCCNELIYSVKGRLAYDGKLCPACLMNKIHTTLHINEEYNK